MTPRHDSIRGWFAAELHDNMSKDDRIWCLTGDLGYAMLDKIRDDFPNRFINVGASEQLMIGAAVGLALSGKIPFCYSITTFLIYRPFEWIRNYIDHEQIPVRLVGSGYDDDYKHDGITHQPYGVYEFLEHNLTNIWMNSHWPKTKEEIPEAVTRMIQENKPSFICLRR